jgi:hypothetical protein
MIYDCETAQISESVKIKKLIEQDWQFVCLVGNYVYFRKQPLVK